MFESEGDCLDRVLNGSGFFVNFIFMTVAVMLQFGKLVLEVFIGLCLFFEMVFEEFNIVTVFVDCFYLFFLDVGHGDNCGRVKMVGLVVVFK